MTRKDYIALAEALREAKEIAAQTIGAPGVRGVTYAGDRLAAVLKQENPRFDRYRFLHAAGLA